MKRKENIDMEEQLSHQIPDFDETDTPDVDEQAPQYKNEASQYLGTKLGHTPGKSILEDKEADERMKTEKHLTRVGERIQDNAFIRDGWMLVDRALLGERSYFYPSDWQFYVRPATVEAIRNWSTIDEEHGSSVGDVFNEILKTCLTIRTSSGPRPWSAINAWDRFFFVLTIREYTMKNGETKIKYIEDCINCDTPIEFELTSQSLMWDMPDQEVMSNYDPETQTWVIDPTDYLDDYDGDAITLYLPTLEKDANIKEWMRSRFQENRNAKIDPVFIKHLIWMAPKISKDLTIANKQIREYQHKFNSWDIPMFSFMDDVVRNIVVNPGTSIKTICPACGEEVTSPIRFPDGVSALFNVVNKRRKFGQK